MSDTTAQKEETVEIVKTPDPEWGKGRPPRARADEVKKATEEKKALRVKKGRDGAVVINEDIKLEEFVKAFLQNGGNATQAALDVFNCSSVGSAASVGSRYLKKAKDLGLVRVLMEKKGYTYDKMLDHALSKMVTSNEVHWFDRVMKMADYEDFLNKQKGNSGPVQVNILSAQKDISQSFGFAEEEEVIEGDET